MSFAEKWKSKMDSYDNKDIRDKRVEMNYQQCASVPSVPFVEERENANLSKQDPFQVSGESVKVFFPILKGDVWLCLRCPGTRTCEV